MRADRARGRHAAQRASVRAHRLQRMTRAAGPARAPPRQRGTRHRARARSRCDPTRRPVRERRTRRLAHVYNFGRFFVSLFLVDNQKKPNITLIV